MRKFNPIYHSGIASNWRRMANIPDNITDKQIYDIVDRELLAGINGSPETIEEIEYLRQELGLEK